MGDEARAAEVLRDGEADVLGRMPWSSNATFLVNCALDGDEVLAIYKPQRGERGRATFTAYTKDGPRTHKASNVGPTPFHNISFIFNSPKPSGFTPGSRGTGYAQVMDNERARGWRLVLESGQSAPAITQAAPGIRIVVSGGELVESVSGQPDRAMSPKMGEFFRQDAGVTRAVRNTGSTRLELVEFEIK